MRHLILYEYVWKETLLMKSWEIIFGRHYYASKRPTFKQLFFVFYNFASLFDKTFKKLNTPFCSLWEALSVKRILFWHTVNVSEQNLFFVHLILVLRIVNLGSSQFWFSYIKFQIKKYSDLLPSCRKMFSLSFQ